jgi:hypothetical protein
MLADALSPFGAVLQQAERYRRYADLSICRWADRSILFIVKTPRSVRLLEKSEAALIAAIEVFNKPDFRYREETFALLALNAWELLLKAKLLAEKKNDPRVIYIYEKHEKKTGGKTTKLYVRRNRSGNAQTVGLGRAIAILENRTTVKLDPAVKTNLDALTEIRDNAAHFMNASPQLAKQILEIGTATIRNYVTAITGWFSRDLSKYNLYLMPLAFIGGGTQAAVVNLSGTEKNLLNYLVTLSAGTSPASEYHVSLVVNLSFKKSPAPGIPVVITDDPSATHVILSEEDIRKQYPWDYAELTNRLKNRYLDFKENQKYHGIRKPLETDLRYVYPRHLDPANPKSGTKRFYRPDVLDVLDAHYTRK